MHAHTQANDLRLALRDQAYQKVLVDIKEEKGKYAAREMYLQSAVLFLRAAFSNDESYHELSAVEARQIAVLKPRHAHAKHGTARVRVCMRART